MSRPYSEDSFLNAIMVKCPSPSPCPFCGKISYVSTPDMAMIQIQNETNAIHIGRAIPCGVLVCSNCGHVNFFALGALGLLPKDEVNNDAAK